ncbi:alpha-2A adrenergic receptor-like [Amphiura filiformis]|uniref:alpha-2A adrenergic receptor-like n=1 Tax=Amphiura filiformis TaxID=82378 RepID=UPI003B2127FB
MAVIEDNSNTTLLYYEDKSDGHRYILLLLLLMPIFGTVGNLLVIVSVFYIRHLRKPCNYLFASLALADVLVCVLLMPTAFANMLHEVHDGRWGFGDTCCKVFICIDIILTTATIWNLALISLDRFFAINKPLWYAHYRNTKTAIGGIVFTWSVSILISFPVILFPTGQYLGPDQSDGFICMPQKTIIWIVVPVVSFYIPCALLVFLYCLIFRATRRLMTPEKGRPSEGPNVKSNPVLMALLNKNDEMTSPTTSGGDKLVSASESTSNLNTLTTSEVVTISQSIKPSPRPRMKSFSEVRQQRASRVLAAVITAFICCWFPFFCFITINYYSSYYINPITFHIVHWCGWCNSILNPLLYASLKGDFQNAFKKIFCLLNSGKTLGSQVRQ